MHEFSENTKLINEQADLRTTLDDQLGKLEGQIDRYNSQLDHTSSDIDALNAVSKAIDLACD